VDAPAGKSLRLVASVFAAGSVTARLGVAGGPSVERTLAAGWGTLVLDLPPAPGAFRDLVFEISGLPPENFGVREVLVLE
jgi:hypothetical protein